MASGPTLVFGQLTFPLNKITSSVGRKDRITGQVPDVDLGTLDQERSVSRRHAEMSYEHGTTSLRDLGSTNGTTVNGERLALQVDQALKEGDRVGFGGVEMVFMPLFDWPEGVEAEWPPEEPDSMAEETMVSGPMNAEETMVAPPADFASSETMVYAPTEAFAPVEEPPAAPAEPAAAETYEPAAEAAETYEPAVDAEPVAAATYEPAVEAPEPEPVAAFAEAPRTPEPVAMEAYVTCSNHPHLPAIGVCPGCLEAFCVDCLPEREDGLMVCNRCAGISYRLGAASAAALPAPQVTAAPAGGMPSPSAFPDPVPSAVMPQPAPPPVDGEKKKKWPF